jgi:hypothetical protein
MMNFVSQIFLEANFEIEELVIKSSNDDYKSLFTKRLTGGKFDFFLLLSVEEKNLDLEELDTLMNRFLEEIVSTQAYPGLDKNLSLLLLVERETIATTDEFNKIVYSIEENPYHFKKYLLPYTKEQFSLLENYINKESKIIEQLDLMVINKEWFSLFKAQVELNETHEAKLFDLVSKLYIKFPFFKIHLNKEELPNLTKEISEEISISDKEIVEKILAINSKDPKWEDILTALGVEIDEI